MAVMLVLVLLGSGMVTCGDTSPDLTSTVIQYSDTCKYSYNGFRCGDQCKWGGYCECGNTTIDIRRDAQQCCMPAEDSQDRIGAEGAVIGIHELCHSRCYNSYIQLAPYFLRIRMHALNRQGCINLQNLCGHHQE